MSALKSKNKSDSIESMKWLSWIPDWMINFDLDTYKSDQRKNVIETEKKYWKKKFSFITDKRLHITLDREWPFITNSAGTWIVETLASTHIELNKYVVESVSDDKRSLVLNGLDIKNEDIKHIYFIRPLFTAPFTSEPNIKIYTKKEEPQQFANVMYTGIVGGFVGGEICDEPVKFVDDGKTDEPIR